LAGGSGGQIKYSTIEGNTSFGDGGGIRVDHSEGCALVVTSNLDIRGTTISANRALGDGGGIFWSGERGIVARESTITGNSAARGGGIYNKFCNDYFKLEHITVALNTASLQGGGLVLDRSIGGSSVELNNSLFAKNTIGGSPLPSQSGADLFGPSYTAGGNALVGTREGWSCFDPGSGPCEDTLVPSPGNVLDPKIGALGNFGGLTRVHPLLTGSPAIDGIHCPDSSCSNPSGFPMDQRMFPRSIFQPTANDYLPREGNGAPEPGRDLGSFELQCSAELVTNPQFEVSTSGWVGSFGTTIALSEGLGQNSFHALRVINRNLGTWQGPNYSLLGIAQPGNTLQVSGWVKVEGDQSEPVRLTRRAQCAGAQPTFQTVASGIATDEQFVFLGGTATVPSCTLTDLAIYFEGPQVGLNMQVDEVSVFRSGAPCESIPTQLPLAASLPIASDWGTGFCADLKIGNPNSAPTTNWSAAFNLNGATITQIWNLSSSASSGQITVTPQAAWSRVIPALGVSNSLGFCANRAPNSGALPSAPTVTGSF
jgi:cellulase/cellobiase CelA1